MAETQQKAKREQAALIKSSRWRTLLVVIAFYLVAMVILYGHMHIWPQEFRQGLVVPYTIFAPVTFEYVDTQELAKLTGFMEDGKPTVIIDSAKKEQSLARLSEFKEEFYELRQSLIHDDWDENELTNRISQLGAKYGLIDGLLDTVLPSFLAFDDQRLDSLFSTAEVNLRETMDLGVNSSFLRTLKQGGVPELAVTPENIYIYFLQPNLTEYTSPDLRDKRVDMATIIIEKGSVIIAKGDVMDTRAREQLDAVMDSIRAQKVFLWIGIGLVLLIILFWWYFYFQRYAAHLLTPRATSQLAGLILLFLIVGLLIGRLPFNFFFYAATFAVAALATLIVLVYDATFASYCSIGLGFVLSLALGFESDLMLYTLAGGLLPAVFVTPGSSRRQLVWFSFALGLFNSLLAATILLFSSQALRWEILVIAFLAGFVSAILAQGLLPVVEMLSSQLTPGQLVELANPENELLRKLKREAHGTFIHSEMVADLTEEAAKDIKANWLLAKVGALYHDIGKLKRPGFFAENIHDLNKNPHQNLPPETSVKILRDHVINGLEMAREERLPVELHQFIAEHHGNYLIRYFYYKAQKLHEANPEEFPEPDINDYRYDGPIPQNRETGVVMLADVTEAVVRARGIFEPAEIEKVVEQIVSDKLNEDQLTESSLTVGDLHRIKRAFCRILVAQRHHRVRYPEEMLTPVQFHYADNNSNDYPEKPAKGS